VGGCWDGEQLWIFVKISKGSSSTSSSIKIKIMINIKTEVLCTGPAVPGMRRRRYKIPWPSLQWHSSGRLSERQE
jgi:hypothetical protein